MLFNLQTGFDFRALEIAERLEQRMATYEQVLRGAQGFLLAFTGAAYPARDDFHVYVAAVRLEGHYPGIQGIAISQIALPQVHPKFDAPILGLSPVITQLAN